MTTTVNRLVATSLGLLALLVTVTPNRADAAPPYYHPPSPPKHLTASEITQPTDTVFRNATFRAANPTLYGRTDPPVTPVTMYAEWVPITHVYYVWYPGQHDNFFYGITDAIMQHGGGALVSLIVDDAAHQTSLQSEISSRGGNLSLVEFVDVSGYPFYGSYPTDSYWTVDYGPYWVTDGAGNVGITDPRYYPTRTNDDAIPTKLADILGVNVWRPDLNFEGGNLTSDGAGTCFASRAHLFHNLPLLPYQVDEILWDYFDCEKMIWLEPLDSESTGHHDMFSKMLTPTTWIMGEYTAAQDPVNATILNDNAALLASETTAGGQPINVVRIPMPNKGGSGFATVWRTYTNAILVNNVVIVPTYADEGSNEAAALAVYQSVLPGHTIVGVDADSIIPEGGAVHCVTRTRPAATLAMIEAAPALSCGGDWDCPPTSGCGDIDYSGLCIDNTAVYCDNGNLSQETCTGGEVCGWDTTDEYVNCVPTGCGSYTASGTCESDTNGVWFAIWCDSNYPLADRCAPTDTCAMDATLGHVTCQDPCGDECTTGETGCSTDGTQTWTCGEAGDGDTCTDRLYTTCPDSTTCQNGSCVCADECSTGETGCSADSSQRWTCGEIGDGDTCTEEVYANCDPGTTCTNGQCPTTCADECTTGETGCSADTSQRWTCGEAGDGDDCTEVLNTPCDPDHHCDNGSCVPDADPPVARGAACACQATDPREGAAPSILLMILLGLGLGLIRIRRGVGARLRSA